MNRDASLRRIADRDVKDGTESGVVEFARKSSDVLSQAGFTKSNMGENTP
jgi:hypothetical protein